MDYLVVPNLDTEFHRRPTLLRRLVFSKDSLLKATCSQGGGLAFRLFDASQEKLKGLQHRLSAYTPEPGNFRGDTARAEMLA